MDQPTGSPHPAKNPNLTVSYPTGPLPGAVGQNCIKPPIVVLLSGGYRQANPPGILGNGKGLETARGLPECQFRDSRFDPSSDGGSRTWERG